MWNKISESVSCLSSFENKNLANHVQLSFQLQKNDAIHSKIIIIMTQDSQIIYEHPEHPEIHKMDWQFFIKVSYIEID